MVFLFCNLNFILILFYYFQPVGNNQNAINRPGSRVGIIDSSRFNHYVNFQEIQQNLRFVIISLSAQCEFFFFADNFVYLFCMLVINECFKLHFLFKILNIFIKFKLLSFAWC